MPNPIFKQFYEKLGDLIEEGGDALLIEKGPSLIKEWSKKEGFFENIETVHAKEKYTRTKIVGKPEKHVIYFMEWTPGYTLIPHHHHGKSTFEFLVEGKLGVIDWKVQKNGNETYSLSNIAEQWVTPRECFLVNAKITDVHSVYSPVRSKSIHIFVKDHESSEGYVCNEDDTYTKKTFPLKKDAILS